MKKKVFIIALLVLCCLPLFAAEVFYKQLPAMFLVNLEETFYKSHSGSATWTSGSATSSSSTSYYYDNQIIAVLGVSGVTERTKDITFSVTLESGSWLYLLDPLDTTISRPFGLDLIVKGYGTNEGKTSYVEQYIEMDGSDGHVYRMGLQGDGITSATKGSVSFTLDADDVVDDYGGTVWFDVCLVLPTLNSDGTITIGGTTYTAKGSDKLYTSGLSISVSIGDTTTLYNINMTGTYKSSSSSTETGLLKSMMTVLPTASATSLNIQGMGTNDVSVATYSYMTESKFIDDIGYEENKAYLFLSSTSDQTAAGEKFKLRRVRDNGSYSPTDNKYNSVTFVAYIVSDDGTSKEFDGSTTYSQRSTSGFEIKPETVTSQNGNKYVRWHSSGTIKVKIAQTESEDVTALTAGKYTETIYIHVVSPE